MSHGARPHSVPFAILLAVLAALALAACGSDLEEQLSELRVLQQSGQFEESIEPLRGILDRRPDHPEANYRLGLALVQTGRSGEATWPLRKAADSEEFAVPASLTLASTLLRAQNYEQAIEVVSRALERDPENLALRLVRGNALLASGSPEPALEAAERVLGQQPDHFRGLALKASALTELERNDEAEATLRRVQELASESGQPGLEAQSCAVLARFYKGRAEREKVDAQFAECLERYPTQQRVLRWAAAHYDETGRPEKGDAAWRRAIEELPDAYTYRKVLAKRIQERGELEAAEEVLVEATQLFGSGQSWLDLAALRRERGNSAGAREALAKALERAGPQANEQLRFQQADVLVDLGELEEAESVVAELEEPVYRELIRARILTEEGRPEEALELFDEALERWPNNSRARYLAGMAAEAAGKLDRAVAEYRESFRASPKESEGALAAARIQLARGSYQAAAELGAQDAKQRPAGQGEGFLLAARALRAAGAPERALAVLDTLEEDYPERSLSATVERAAVKRRLEGPEAAAAAIEESGLELSAPASLPALRLWAGARAESGGLDEALARVEALAERHPERPGLHDLRGRLLARAGRDEAARSAFERALEIEPEHAAALQGLASMRAASGDREGALALLERAELSETESVEARYGAAQILLAMGRREEAEKRLRSVLEQRPAHARACNDLAWLLAEQERELGYALELAGRATRLEPSATTLDTLGWVHLQRGEAERAVAVLERALERDPASPSVRYRLGLALEAAGDEAGAVEALRRAVGSGDFPESEAARSELARLEAR